MIVDYLRKMIYYKLVNIIINILGLAKNIINMVVCYHDIPESIVTDQKLLFISKSWFLLYYFLGIKKKLSTAFYQETDG